MGAFNEAETELLLWLLDHEKQLASDNDDQPRLQVAINLQIKLSAMGVPSNEATN